MLLLAGHCQLLDASVQDSRNGMVWLYDITSTNCQMVFTCHSKQASGFNASSHRSKFSRTVRDWR